jgi:hypothetical protein
LADAAEPFKNRLIHELGETPRGVPVEPVANRSLGKSKWGLQGLVSSFLHFSFGSGSGLT